MAATATSLEYVQKMFLAYFGRPVAPTGQEYYGQLVDAGNVAALQDDFWNSAESSAVFGSLSTEGKVNAIFNQLFGRDALTAGLTYWTTEINAGRVSLPQAALTILNSAAAADLTAFNAKLTAATAFTDALDTTDEILAYQSNTDGGRDFISGIDSAAEATAAVADIDAIVAAVVAGGSSAGAGLTFELSALEAADGADIMRLTGDMDVRIDLTANNNQVKGLDVDGDGAIEPNGIENNNPTAQDDGKDFEIVDAYSRDLLDQGNINENFLGDISFDGTGFSGDGANADGNLDGNIFLGGLGADTALGGVGNDFMTGGGVADPMRPFDMNENGTIEPGEVVAVGDTLFGSRNADFFFAELSLLDSTDGNNLTIHGGQTSDDAAVGNNTAQDTDWLLLEVSDDEDGTIVDLSDETDLDTNQFVMTGAGRTISMDEIENVDASGNLYGFLNGIDVAVGGAGSVVDNDDGADQNVGIGSSAQLHIIGSVANNILVGGFDNDLIEGAAGNDLLFGGNLNYLNNVNLLDIVNNGMDEMDGGAGNDGIVFEADGGTINGGANTDTLWLTREALGTGSASDMTTDNMLRFDLSADNLASASGYGGADATDARVGGTGSQDQTNYSSNASRVDITAMENVIATGLGAVDYLAAGTNDPELSFNNQQNHQAYNGNLDLRGSGAANTLYAADGVDVLEGRTGNDLLSGGEGNDDFLFNLQAGDGLDTIHRQTDIGGNLTDGTFGRDFGLGGDSVTGPSSLSVDFAAANLADANVFMDSFSVEIGGETFAVSDLDALADVTTVAELAALANAAFQAIDSNVSVSAAGSVLTITDATSTGGRDISDTQVEGYDVSIKVIAPGNGSLGLPVFAAPGTDEAVDRLLFVAYQDRLDNERVDDDAVFGGDSLGGNAYAQDIVANFDVDGSTVLAESQQFRVDLTNLAVEDVVTVNVNGVEYTLQVGKDRDGTLIAGETTAEFAERLAGYINDFLDDDTAAGKISAAFNPDQGDTDDPDTVPNEATDGVDDTANTGSFTLTQDAYAGEEVVFMQVSVDVTNNSSQGEGATASVVNQSSTDITLFEFDGRNGELNADNVLFLGDSGNSRAVFETAADIGGNLFGSDAIVVNVRDDDDVVSSAAEGIDGADIFFNDAENPTTGETTNYAIHGDDQLFGGDGNDTVRGGTGDDRVYGSLGTDSIDGGKDLYLVDGVIRVLNDAEATDVDADPDTIKIRLIGDKDGDGAVGDDGISAQQTGSFDDTLIYQQSDFGAVGVDGATFNIALDLTAAQNNGGAGRVIVNGLAANTTLFTNMENIRTVSGDGTLAGQGNDTLDLSISVNPLTGVTTPNAFNMRYDLTSAGTAGNVDLDRNDNGAWAGAEVGISKVDGVEHVTFGSGDDTLLIDETEAGKNNDIVGGLGTDIVSYSFDVDGDDDFNPAVTLTVNGGGAGIDHVDMQGGILMDGDVPRDTLNGVERINFNDTLDNPTLNDTLDVTNVNDAVVDFVLGQVRTGAGAVQVLIGNMQDFEIVNADFDDTVIVSETMANSRLADDDQDVQFDSFLNFDTVNGAGNRMSIADLRAAGDDLPQAENIGLYQFNMGQDTDTVDYSHESGLIAAVVDFTQDTPSVANVLVSHDGDTDFADDAADDGNRVDSITDTENLVASNGTSIIDLTGADQNLRISFSNNYDNVADWDAGFNADYGRETHEIKVASAVTGSSVVSMNFLDYRFVDTDTTDLVAARDSAFWNRIEGSDFNEEVDLSGWEADEDNILNLRGGDNQVNYEGDSVAITIDVVAFDENDPTTTGLVEVSALHTAPGDDHDAGTVDAAVSGTDTITSYSAQNEVAAGSLTIKGARGDLDSIAFAGGLDGKFFILGGVTDATSSITVTIGSGTDANSLELVGFETLQDADTDDTYTMDDLSQVQNDLSFLDNVAADRDTIKVGDDAIDFDGGPDELDTNNGGANTGTISLEVLNDVFGFDFDVLDITNVTDNNLIVVADDDDQDGDLTLNAADTDYVGPGDADGDGDLDVARDLSQDDIVVGDLDLIDSITGFDTIYFTNASITSAGTEYVLDVTGAQLEDDSAALFTLDSSSMNFSLVTGSDLTLSAISATGVEIVGSDGDDTITGSAGADTLEGGAGDDTIDGGIATEVRQIQLAGILDATVDAAAVTIALGDLGITLTINESAAPADVDATDGDLDILAGSGSDAVGAALAALVNANLTAINVANNFDVDDGVGGAVTNGNADVALLSASYDSGTDLLTFTFASGADVDVDAAIVVASGDTGVSFVASTDSAISEGGDGGADTFVFAATAADNGVDTITGFQAGADFLDFTNLGGDSNAHDVAANAAAQNMHGDGEVYVFADGADGTGAATITNYNSTTQVAAFLAAAFDDESAFSLDDGTGWISAVINDTLTDTAYVYDVRVGSDDVLDADSVTLIGVVHVDAALTTGDVIN